MKIKTRIIISYKELVHIISISLCVVLLLGIFGFVVEPTNAELKTVTGLIDEQMNHFIKTLHNNTSDEWGKNINTILLQNKDSFNWKEISKKDGVWKNFKWSGKTATSNEGDVTTNPQKIPDVNNQVWYVYSGEQLKYALENVQDGQTITLKSNIDLNGYNHKWSTVDVSASFTLDGNGYTIYNLGVFDINSETPVGFLAKTSDKNIKIHNINFANAKLVAKNTATIFPLNTAVNEQGFLKFENVSVVDSFVYSHSTDGNIGVGILTNGNVGHSELSVNKCIIANSFIYGTNNVGGISGVSDNATITNNILIDNVIIGTKGNSAGVIASTNNNLSVKNSFTNNMVYSKTKAGNFIGVVSGNTLIENCYASGIVQGQSEIGGFIGLIDIAKNLQSINVKNCYTTSMVGMMNGGRKIGGFVGSIIENNNISSKDISFIDCYCAGEVGNIDTISNDLEQHLRKFSDVGGFLGFDNLKNAKVNYENCYYDKQTTAMREWTKGNSKIVDGIKGVLTTKTDKSGAGLTNQPSSNGFTGFSDNTQWFFQDKYPQSYYPQLNVFKNATTSDWGNTEIVNLVKAYSKASVATVFLNTWEKDLDGNILPQTTYDTVRDITQNFNITSELLNGYLKWNSNETTTQILGKEKRILSLRQEDKINYVDILAKGVEWLTVNAVSSDKIGNRKIRVTPTMFLIAGDTKAIKINTDLYDHADDVQFGYSTACKMAQSLNDITTGIYPDQLRDTNDSWSNQQKLAQHNLNEPYLLYGNDKYNNVSLDPIAKGSKIAKVEIKRINSINKDEILQTEKPLSLLDKSKQADKWNGYLPFDSADKGAYSIGYYWVLQDKRYVFGEKIITVTDKENMSNKLDKNYKQKYDNQIYLHIRQVVADDSIKEELGVPEQGYVKLTNLKSVEDDKQGEKYNRIVVSGKESETKNYTTTIIRKSKGHDIFNIQPVIPMYYKLKSITVGDTMINQTKTTQIDTSNINEFWITIYIEPTLPKEQSETFYSQDKQIISFGKL